MRKNKIKLRVQPIYSIAIYYVLGLISVFFMFMPMLLSWERSSLIIEILCYLVLIFFCVYGFIQGTLHIQFAEIDKEKIIIKNLFYTIAVLKWVEISSVRKEKILTYDSRGHIYLEWLVIRTDDTQEVPYRAKHNAKGVFPILIMANKKNLDIIGKYIKIEQ